VVRSHARRTRLMRTLRIEFLLALAAGLALAVVPAAQGANIITPAHNPGFEDSCVVNMTTVPCAWGTTTAAAAVVQDPLHHSGSFSGRVTLTNVDANGIVTTCIVGQLPAGYHTASYWYHTSDTNVGDLYMNFLGYTSNDCTGAGQGDPVGALTVASIKDASSWHQVSGVLHNSSTKNSVKVELFFQCTPCSGAPVTTTATVYYDDVSFEDVTAVAIVSFTAARTATGARLRWRTGTEADMLGFHVYRSRGAGWTRVDPKLIRARGSVAGARYSLVDRRAPSGKLTYRLQAIGTDGSRTWYGRAIIAR
jgi:hypothetical protein